MIKASPGAVHGDERPAASVIRNAYGITEDSRIVDAPGWIVSGRFDIVAIGLGDVLRSFQAVRSVR